MAGIDARFEAALAQTLESTDERLISLEAFIKNHFDVLTRLRSEGLSWGVIGQVIKKAEIRFRGDVEPTNRALSDAYRAVRRRLARDGATRGPRHVKAGASTASAIGPLPIGVRGVGEPGTINSSQDSGANTAPGVTPLPPIKSNVSDLSSRIDEGAARRRRLEEV